MKVTINFGGSILNPDEIDVEVIKTISKTLKQLKKEGHEILVVTGGGRTARRYIQAGKELGISHKDLDIIGIAVTRLNAQLLISSLGEIAEEKPTENFEKANRSTFKNKIPVMGGTKPGHTTDAVAAKLAETSDSKMLIFFTDVDGVYTADPKKNKKAEKIDKMTTAELSDLMKKMKFEPGMTTIIDPMATRIIQGAKIKSLVLGKNEIERLPEIMDGAAHSGTLILPPGNK